MQAARTSSNTNSLRQERKNSLRTHHHPGRICVIPDVRRDQFSLRNTARTASHGELQSLPHAFDRIRHVLQPTRRRHRCPLTCRTIVDRSSVEPREETQSPHVASITAPAHDTCSRLCSRPPDLNQDTCVRAVGGRTVIPAHAAVVCGREERDQVTIGVQVEAVHSDLVRLPEFDGGDGVGLGVVAAATLEALVGVGWRWLARRELTRMIIRSRFRVRNPRTMLSSNVQIPSPIGPGSVSAARLKTPRSTRATPSAKYRGVTAGVDPNPWPGDELVRILLDSARGSPVLL